MVTRGGDASYLFLSVTPKSKMASRDIREAILLLECCSLRYAL